MGSNLPVSDNPFEVLGVPKDVSEKDLKKRYFHLLRQYPPESHPDEFNRVQHAYDQLRDPQARAALEAGEPYEKVAEPYRTRLRDALAQLRNDQVDLARAALKTMVIEKPDLDDARVLLHQVFFDQESYLECEQQVAALVHRNPDNAWYRYRHALVLSRLKRFADAHAASEKWVELSGGKDPRAWEFIADSLASQNRHAEAHQRLDEGLKVVPHPGPLICARMHLRLDQNDKAGLEADLKQLVASLAPNDDEGREGASQRLQSLAAMYFSKALTDEANLLLKTARELGGKDTGVQFPARVELFIEELPEPSREWLIEEVKQPHIFRVPRRGKLTDVLLALMFTAIWGLVALVSVMNESGWPGLLAVLYGLVVLGATAPMVWSWRELTWSFAVPYRRMIAVHPLYMLEVGVEKLVAWPLVNFGEPRIVHQYTNGVYTRSNVTLQFGKKKLGVQITGQQKAQDFAQALHSHRYRALQLMHGGLLEAEVGFDFIPTDFLAPGYRSKLKIEKRKDRAKRWSWSAGVAVVLAIAAAMVGGLRERERVWATAVNTGGPSDVAKALEKRPDGEGSDQLDAYRKAKMSAARRELEAALEKSDPRLLALNALMSEVQKANHPMLHFRSKVLGLEGKGTGAQATQFSEREVTESMGRFPLRLYDGFAQAMTARAREVLAVSPGSAEKGVTVEVALMPRMLERSVQVGRTRWPLLGLTATATLDGQALGEATVELEDGDCALLSSADNATAVLDAQVDRLLWKSGAALTKAFGLAVEP